MKNQYNLKILVVLTLSLLLSCSSKDPDNGRKAVIEGYIKTDSYPVVLFSSSVVPEMEGNLSDVIVNWGKVSISDGDTTIILTGRVDNLYLPPYKYYTTEMTGTPGKTYTVTADFKELHATASVKMPYPVSIDSVTYISSGNGIMKTATLHFTAPEDTPAYFYLSLQNISTNSVPMPCMMGTIETDRPGASYSIAILKPKIKISGEKYNSQFLPGEEWTVGLNRIERSVYDFWTAYSNMLLFSTSPFISSNESLPTNIHGGYGVLSVEGTSTFKMHVP